jgi:hypothetical protein
MRENGGKYTLAPSTTAHPRLPLLAPIPNIFILHLSMVPWSRPPRHFKEKREGGVNVEFRRAVDQNSSARLPANKRAWVATGRVSGSKRIAS